MLFFGIFKIVMIFISSYGLILRTHALSWLSLLTVHTLSSPVIIQKLHTDG